MFLVYVNDDKTREKVPDVPLVGHLTIRRPDVARRQEVKRKNSHTHTHTEIHVHEQSHEQRNRCTNTPHTHCKGY